MSHHGRKRSMYERFKAQFLKLAKYQGDLFLLCEVIMRILVPGNLDFYDSLLFCSILENTSPDKEYQFDFRNLGTVEPFGMLIVGAKLRQFVETHPDSIRQALNYEKATYATHMGFFRSFGMKHGKELGTVQGNENFIPITKIDVQDLREEARKNVEHIIETTEKKAESMAEVLARGETKLIEYLTYSIREIMRNIVEHSEAKSIWISGQYWPTKDIVEIAIIDEGVGIQSSLRNNPYLSIKNDEDALLLSVEPGISGKAFGKMRGQDDWANSGYGLYMTSSICQNGGSFAICSNSRALIFNNEKHKMVETSFRGTAIRMRLKASMVGDLSKKLEELSIEGGKRARDNSKSAIISASKISRILVTRRV